LKYIDPSGHDVEIMGEDYEIMQEMLQRDSLPLYAFLYLGKVMTSPEYKVFDELTEIAPKLTQALLDSEIDIALSMTDTTVNGRTVSGRTARSKDEHGNAIISIEINTSLGHNDAIATLAHESFHALAALNGFFQGSIYEEACAWSYHQAIDEALGRGWFHDTFNPYNDMRPSSPYAWVKRYVADSNWRKSLEYAILQALGRYYPDPNEGSYEMMRALYVDYYPGD
jgi:hypothetical protein